MFINIWMNQIKIIDKMMIYLIFQGMEECMKIWKILCYVQLEYLNYIYLNLIYFQIYCGKGLRFLIILMNLIVFGIVMFF